MDKDRFLSGPNLSNPDFVGKAIGGAALLASVLAIGGPPAFRAFQAEVGRILDSGSGVTQAQADRQFSRSVIAPQIRQELAQDGIVLPPAPRPDHNGE